MSQSATVRLLEAEPDLTRYLTEADVEALDGLPVPLVQVPRGEIDMAALLSAQRAFGLIVLDGLLVRRLVVGEAATLRLVGPGDVIGAQGASSSMLVTARGWQAAAPTKVALLDREVLLAAHRTPRLVAGLHVRAAGQTDRVAVQLAICQLPRVEDRVLSMLWLLAESWGQVTAHGTALRLHLTHQTLGGLVGARRSTVTLAIGQLTENGAIIRQDRGWLLLQSPATVVPPAQPDGAPEPLDLLASAEPEQAHTSPVEVVRRLQRLRDANDQLSIVCAEATGRLGRSLRRLSETRLVSRSLRDEAQAWRSQSRVRARLHHHYDAGDGLRAIQRQTDDAAAEGLAAPVDRVED